MAPDTVDSPESVETRPTVPHCIPVAGPWITQREVDYVTDAVTTAWYGDANKYHQRFETTFAQTVGRQYAMALPSCTSALHLALLALGIGPGDEVIVPEITWIATAAPVSYVGATPVFADIDPQSWCLSAESFKSHMTPRTKAVIVVDLYGNLPDWDALLAIAQEHGIAVIEDAAQAAGATYHNRMAGSFGDVSCFSFHGSKVLTTGEGGMLLTDRADLFHRCEVLRDHGRDPSGKVFWNVEVGYKYRMSSMQAALGLAQIERLEELIAKKRELFSWYQEVLQGVKGLTLNQQAPEVRHIYWMVTAILDPALGIEKEELIRQLKARDIDARPFFYPLSSMPPYAHLESDQPHSPRYGPHSNPVAYQLAPYGINLPSAFSVTQEGVTCVAQALQQILFPQC